MLGERKRSQERHTKKSGDLPRAGELRSEREREGEAEDVKLVLVRAEAAGGVGTLKTE